MKLTVLGSGDAFCAAGSLHSCNVLEHGGGKIVLECGPAILAGLKRNGFNTGDIDAVVVSHLHGDHFGGIPFLFLEYLFENPRTRPLTLVGPPTVLTRSLALYAGYYRELQSFELPFEIKVCEMRPGSRAEVAGFQIESFQVPHNADPVALGYHFTCPEGRVLFSGDSAWTEEFIHRSQDVDLFLCECCTMEPATPMHTAYTDLLAHRDQLGCKRLLLTHLGEDVRAAAEFRYERARDGLIIEF
ncbi:MAG TPA: MBL fold metallo-hydrolase [Candidatus Limnocylindrales bacterium]|nr:MBL fold metallo-hydrolase [Candidatus Limnocylindrales bacterium]